jgi:hypothetical protein
VRQLARALVVLTLAAAAWPAAAAPGPTMPRLRLLSLSPVSVAGAGFPHGERVRVLYGTTRRVIRTSAAGSFRVSFPASSDPCAAPALITAWGARGDSAALKLPARMCPVSPDALAQNASAGSSRAPI